MRCRDVRIVPRTDRRLLVSKSVGEHNLTRGTVLPSSFALFRGSRTIPHGFQGRVVSSTSLELRLGSLDGIAHPDHHGNDDIRSVRVTNSRSDAAIEHSPARRRWVSEQKIHQPRQGRHSSNAKFLSSAVLTEIPRKYLISRQK